MAIKNFDFVGNLLENGKKVITEVDGKGLSTNDYTTEEKNKLAGLATVATSGSYNDLSDKPTSMTPTAHNQASSTINAMTGYSKPSSTGAIATTDTLNAAIGKLEKALDGKQASGSYSTTGHKHTKAEITDFPTLAAVATSGSYNDLTNKPTIPSIAGLATETYVDNKVAGLVDSAPEALNTLGELAEALETHEDAYDALLETVGGKVDKTTTVNGHALSGNVTVTKSDVGLGSVPNVATNDQTPTFTEASTLSNIATGEKVSTLFGKIKKAITDLIVHLANTSNPHSVTKSQVGLGSVVNTGDSATPVSGGTTKFTTGGAYTELAKKVDKVTGKGLSTNDYTTDEKNKLAGIAAGANAYTHPSTHAASMITGLATVATSGSYNDLSNKPTIPAAVTVDTALSSTSTNPVQNKVINTALGNKVDKVSGKGLSTNDLTAALKTNYDTAYTHSQSAHAPSGAEVNQNAFSNVKVGTTTIAADTKTDTIEFAGSNVTITPDATNDKVTFGITKDNVTTALGYTPPTTNTTYSAATTSAAGLMSAADKTKLDGIATGANKYVLPYRLAEVQASGTGCLTDPNNGLQTGFYYVKGTTNRPPFSQSSNDDYRILVTAYGSTWLQQIATDFRCDDIFYRRLENGTWKSWVKIYPTIDITGNAATATKATQDGSGRVIVDTYTTQETFQEFQTELEDGEFIVDSANRAYLADKATALGSSTVGGTAKPIYLNGGTATACSATVGSSTKPVYLNAGTLTACSCATISNSTVGDCIPYLIQKLSSTTSASSYVSGDTMYAVSVFDAVHYDYTEDIEMDTTSSSAECMVSFVNYTNNDIYVYVYCYYDYIDDDGAVMTGDDFFHSRVLVEAQSSASTVFQDSDRDKSDYHWYPSIKGLKYV